MSDLIPEDVVLLWLFCRRTLCVYDLDFGWGWGRVAQSLDVVETYTSVVRQCRDVLYTDCQTAHLQVRGAKLKKLDIKKKVRSEAPSSNS